MAEVFRLDSAYLAAKRDEIKNDITSACYKVGNTWYNAKIEDVKTLSDGRIEASFVIDHTVSGNITVTAIELYDRNGKRIGSRNVSITRADTVEGIFYTCRFSLFQVAENTGKTGNYDAV